MGTSFWQGERIHLRASEPGDWETYFNWNQDDEQARRLYFIHPPQSRETVRRWVEAAATERPEGDAFRWVIANEADEVVGGITTHSCDRRVGTFSYGLNVAVAHRGRGYAAEALTLVLRYYFHELRYQKANAGIYAFNEESIRLHERLGFQLEGRQRRMVFTEGRYHDLLLFGLTTEEFAQRHPSIPAPG